MKSVLSESALQEIHQNVQARTGIRLNSLQARLLIGVYFFKAGEIAASEYGIEGVQ